MIRLLNGAILWVLLTPIIFAALFFALDPIIVSDENLLWLTCLTSPLLSLFILFSFYKFERYMEEQAQIAKMSEKHRKVTQKENEQKLAADRLKKQQEAQKLIEQEKRREELAKQQQAEKICQEKEKDYFERITYLEELRKLDPIEFEQLVGQLFKQMGYIVQTTPKSGDEGIDLFIQKDTRKAVVQCKRYKNNVGQPIVRDLYGAMLHNHADEAYLVTTGNISLPAKKWAEGKQIHLVDGIELMEWLSTFKPDEVL